MGDVISRTKGSEANRDSNTDSSAQSRPNNKSDHNTKSCSNSTAVILSSLHFACQNNNTQYIESCLKRMKLDDIDRTYPPFNETLLHFATRNRQKETIELLLLYGAQRSLKNIDGQQACDLADTPEIRDLFNRPNSSRFAFQQSSIQPETFFQQKIKCHSCSLINDCNFYEWELVGRNATQKALRFRRELKRPIFVSDTDLKRILHSIKKGYINIRLHNIEKNDRDRVNKHFKRALAQQNPFYIVTAYTASQSFSKLLNIDMARNVIHDLNNGCSKFSCPCLYSTEDGIKSLTNILLHHSKFHTLRYQGRVYRGIVLPEHTLDHYTINSCIITTTFLSTSKNPEVAQRFSSVGATNSTKHSFFCIYDIVNQDRTAIDISGISEFPDEVEVLIMPYSSFLITNIVELPGRTEIYLTEQSLTQVSSCHVAE